MFSMPRAVRRSEPRSDRPGRRMPALAAATVVVLVALGAPGAALASADEMASPAETVGGPVDSSSPVEAAGATDPTQATEAPGDQSVGVPDDAPVEAIPPGDEPVGVPGDAPVEAIPPGDQPVGVPGDAPAEAIPPGDSAPGDGDPVVIVNTQPIAVDDHYTTSKNTPLSVTAVLGLLANDSDPDQDPITTQFSQVTVPTEGGGTVFIGLDGSFDYTPAAGFLGLDGFSYNVVDSHGGQAIAVAYVTVLDVVAPVNTPPVAVDDHYATTVDTVLVIDAANGMLLNDSDADGDPLSSIIPAVPYGTASVQGGTVSGTPDGGFTYTPPVGFVGDDEFVYEVMDEAVESFDVGTVRVTVTDAPAEGGPAGGSSEPSPVGPEAPAPEASNAADVSAVAAASVDPVEPIAEGPVSTDLAHTGATPDASLLLSLLLLATGAAGVLVASIAHRRSRRS